MSDRRAATSGPGRQRRAAFAAILGADDDNGAGSSSQKVDDKTTTNATIKHAPSRNVRSVSSLVLNTHATPSRQQYEDRVAGKFVQLANLDRARPKASTGSRAHEQLRKRDKRLVTKDSRDRNRLLASGLEVQTRKARRAVQQKQKREEGRPLSRRQRKLMGLESVDRSVCYESLLPIYSLWLAYVHRLLGLYPQAQVQSKPGKGQGATEAAHSYLAVSKDASGRSQTVLTPSYANSIAATIVKADLCGAPVRVVQSLNPALVGIEGLVANETESTLIIAARPSSDRLRADTAKRSRLKTVPKRNSVFMMQIVLPEQPGVDSSVPNTTATQPRGAMSFVPGQAAVSPYPSKSGAAIMTSAPPADVSVQHAIEIPIYGNQLCNALPTRATRKYKARKTIELGV